MANHSTLTTVLNSLDDYLESSPVKDYGPNGLQVDGGKSTVTAVCTGVTANLEFIERALDWGADLLVVHHGIYWNGAPFKATGALGRRIRALVHGGASLAAYHLPLDAHPIIGNAAGLADALGLAEATREPAFEHRGIHVGNILTLSEPVTAEALVERVQRSVNPEARSFLHGPAEIKRLGIVTGGAARDVAVASNQYRCDAFITGEAGEYSQADSKEEGIHFIAGGHHRTERFGPLAIAQWVTSNFPGVRSTFIDVDNPV